jgi:superfamily II DNA/RNA helicase
VKRFESSFGAFASSIERFLNIHEIVENFIDQSGGKYILDRKLIEAIYQFDEDTILDILYKFENDLLEKKVPKNNTVYDVNKFDQKDQFLADIKNDKELFREIKKELDRLKVVDNDPKRDAVYAKMSQVLQEEEQPKRKIVIFSEYVDTIRHLEGYLRDRLGNRLLVCDGNVTKELSHHLNSDFDAQYKGTQTDHFDVLITSDKLSEGFNLNRAGVIINYDIPWNPTRVIQRIGRINRIGVKLFEELFIYNFFPSETGADVVKSREIASQKMFLIHNSLGEDSKIFEPEEEPTPSGLFNKINQDPYQEEELTTFTLVRNRYKEIQENYPDVINKIEQLPLRVKTAKSASENQLAVLRRKGLSLFSQVVNEPSKEKNQVESKIFEDFLPMVECEYDEPRLDLSKNFWPAYNAIKAYKAQIRTGRSDMALESKALTNLKLGLKLLDPREESLAEFMKILIKDIRKYHTLSIRTLGRLGRKKLSKNSGKKEQKAFFDEVRWLEHQLGHNYLQDILKRVENQRNEVIIAVENINNSNE